MAFLCPDHLDEVTSLRKLVLTFVFGQPKSLSVIQRIPTLLAPNAKRLAISRRSYSVPAAATIITPAAWNRPWLLRLRFALVGSAQIAKCANIASKRSIICSFWEGLTEVVLLGATVMTVECWCAIPATKDITSTACSLQ